jgi:hypothetical protein
VKRAKLLGGSGVIILSLTMLIAKNTSGKGFECQGQFFFHIVDWVCDFYNYFVQKSNRIGALKQPLLVILIQIEEQL